MGHALQTITSKKAEMICWDSSKENLKGRREKTFKTKNSQRIFLKNKKKIAPSNLLVNLIFQPKPKRKWARNAIQLSISWKTSLYILLLVSKERLLLPKMWGTVLRKIYLQWWNPVTNGSTAKRNLAGRISNHPNRSRYQCSSFLSKMKLKSSYRLSQL